MRLKYIFLIAIFIVFAAPSIAMAQPADVTGVRQMLTAFDNQDFSIFDEESLITSLVEIIVNDPVDAEYHDRVVRGALAVLGELHAPEAIGLLIDNLDTHTTTCLYWLGTYATTDSIEAIAEYLGNEDPSVRYEAASALGTIPLDEFSTGVSGEVNVPVEITDAVKAVMELINSRLDVEDDTDVIAALTVAKDHLSEL
ncbi:MAG: HEAT repeat domain-containing protein [bacterium]|nr:HEAT repeat domain-containing protein [bacterium]